MVSRQVQNVSSLSPRRSASPAIARWKAWLCRLASAGTPSAWRSSPGCGGASVSTAPMRAPSSVTRTSERQPSGVSARAKCKCGHVDSRRLTRLCLYIKADAGEGQAHGSSACSRSGATPGWPPAPARGLGVIERGALVTRSGPHRLRRPRGRRADAPTETVDCEGRWITPALIDCHTHLVYGGDRAREFELRLGRRVL